jgi:precorrin-6A/cobalt-precorrin-6A reductase
VRVGGFGGTAGLAAALDGVAALVDATHPFAATMTAHAAAAAAATGTPLLRLQRPGWTAQPGDDWRWVDSLADAATAVAGARVVLLTTGRQGLAAFAGLSAHCVVRSVDPPEPPLPARATVVLARGPFTVEGERALMTAHGVDVVVTKDSGGPMTAAKLTAARELGVPVVLVRRPPLPEGVPVAATVEQAAAWVLRPSRGSGTTRPPATPRRP